MQDEDIFLGQNDLGTIFMRLNSLEKLFLVTPLRRYGIC